MMIDDNDDKLGEEILDELLNEYSDICPGDPKLALFEMDFTEDWMSESSIPFQEAHPINEPIRISEDSSSDIPTDPKEWPIYDQMTKRHRAPRLFEFLILLLEKSHYTSYASYKDKSRGIFQIHEPEKVADLWQQVKNRHSVQKMTYDKFARAIRWYYKLDIMKKTNARYTFQFSPRTREPYAIYENNNTAMNYSYANQ